MGKEIFKSYDQSRAVYREYVMRHILAVQKMFAEFGDILIDLYLIESFYVNDESLADVLKAKTAYNILSHDQSKLSPEEFDAYAAKFYPCEADLRDKDAIERNFKKAWVHHYTHNKHHPEYWICYSNYDKNEYNVVKMSDTAFIEMICDWMAMSYIKGGTVKSWWYGGAYKEKSELMTTRHIQIIEVMLNHPMDYLTREVPACEIP